MVIIELKFQIRLPRIYLCYYIDRVDIINMLEYPPKLEYIMIPYLAYQKCYIPKYKGYPIYIPINTKFPIPLLPIRKPICYSEKYLFDNDLILENQFNYDGYFSENINMTRNDSIFNYLITKPLFRRFNIFGIKNFSINLTNIYSYIFGYGIAFEYGDNMYGFGYAYAFNKIYNREKAYVECYDYQLGKYILFRDVNAKPNMLNYYIGRIEFDKTLKFYDVSDIISIENLSVDRIIYFMVTFACKPIVTCNLKFNAYFCHY